MPVITLLILLLLAPASGTSQTTQVPSPKAPSPIVAQTRPHPRIPQTESPGRRLDLKSLKGARLCTSPGVNPNKPVPLLVHFHGAPWLIETHIARYLPNAALITVQLGAGSSAYRRPFENPGLFRELLDEAAQALSIKRGWSSVTLTGFSAGYGGIREILRRPEYFALVNNVLLLDGIHASYAPTGQLLADGGTIQASDIDVFVSFAREAYARRKTFVVTHSEIFPGTYASTTECADYLLAHLGGAVAHRDGAVARPRGPRPGSTAGVGRLGRAQPAPMAFKRRSKPVNGPMGMQQLSAVDAGRFHLRGYAGNTAPDHVDFLHAMPSWFGLLRVK